MSDEPTIRYCMEHSTVAIYSDLRCRAYASECQEVTLHRRPVIVETGFAWYAWHVDDAGTPDGFIWTEEP